MITNIITQSFTASFGNTVCPSFDEVIERVRRLFPDLTEQTRIIETLRDFQGFFLAGCPKEKIREVCSSIRNSLPGLYERLIESSVISFCPNDIDTTPFSSSATSSTVSVSTAKTTLATRISSPATTITPIEEDKTGALFLVLTTLFILFSMGTFIYHEKPTFIDRLFRRSNDQYVHLEAERNP